MPCVCLCVGEYMLPASSPVGLHKLVQSLCGLQGERSQLRGELRSLHSQLEQRERDRHTKVQAFQQQVMSITHPVTSHLTHNMYSCYQRCFQIPGISTYSSLYLTNDPESISFFALLIYKSVYFIHSATSPSVYSVSSILFTHFSFQTF